MTINYTSLLGLAEPVTGTESGTWGDDVNKGITDYLDIAIAGTQTISGSQTAVTLSVTNGSSAGNNIAQAGSGSTGSSQYQIINCTGSPASLLTITAPASSKTYVIINATSTSQSVKIVGAGPTTGVTVATGQRALVAWNGSDFVQVGASAGGSTTQVQYNNSGALAGSANLTFNGTTLTANTLNLTNALGVAYGGSGAATFTANNVLLGNGTSAFQVVAPGTNGNVLTSNGTTWTSTAPVASGGTVTTVSVVSTNGFTGTVANATTTPAITLTTSITGLLQGNGTAISAVTVGSGLSFVGGTLSATSGSTSIGLVRAISINCILP